MLKQSTNKWMRLSHLALIPMLAVFVFACRSSNNNAPAQDAVVPAPEAATPQTNTEAIIPETTQESIPYEVVEKKPTFNGGSVSEFAQWTNSQLKYPDSAIEDAVQGRILISFTVSADGYITDAKVLRGVSPELDAEALRVVSSCTEKWEPGMQDGKPVPVSITFPITFQLR